MQSRKIKEKLEAAVIKEDLADVKRLLSASGDAKTSGWFGESYIFLHLTESAEITKELLSYGAYIDARNRNGETPLLFALKAGKKMELVSELLKHGADVNKTDYRGNTAFNFSVKKTEELFKYGADINIRNGSSVGHAVDRLACAKLFIKFNLLNNFREAYVKIIILDVYNVRIYNYHSEMSRYQDDCVSEILKMKADMIVGNISLFKLITNNININSSCNNQLSIRLAKYDYSIYYPVYEDVILEKIEPFIERASLLSKIDDIHIYTESDVSNQGAKEKKILNPYSVYSIAEYLSNNELLNLIIAFCDFGKQTNKFSSHANNLELNKQSDRRLSKSSANIYSNLAKRVRLE